MPPRDTKICCICGKEFESWKSRKTTTCSKECSLERRRRNKMSEAKRAEISARLAGTDPESAQKGRAKMLENPMNQRGEQNKKSKIWELIDPYGNHIEVIGLMSWARENAPRFGKTGSKKDVQLIMNGFVRIGRALNGTTKKGEQQFFSYFGWTLAGPPRDKPEAMKEEYRRNIMKKEIMDLIKINGAKSEYRLNRVFRLVSDRIDNFGVNIEISKKEPESVRVTLIGDRINGAEYSLREEIEARNYEEIIQEIEAKMRKCIEKVAEQMCSELRHGYTTR